MADGCSRCLYMQKLNERQYVQCQGYYWSKGTGGLFASGVHQVSEESR